MRKLCELSLRADFWLLLRVFMPIAHWVDYRFHKNHYDLAGVLLSAALAMFGAKVTQSFIKDWHFGIILGMAWLMNVYIYTDYIRRLHRASIAYERNPAVIPIDAHVFFVFPFGRFGLLFIGLPGLCLTVMIAVTEPGVRSVVDAVTSVWLPLIACAMYFGGCLPSGRERKRKREWSWGQLMPAPTH